MTLRRTASQRPQFGKLSNGEWRTAIYQPKGEYLEALIRSCREQIARMNPEHDPAGRRARLIAEIDRLEGLQRDLREARALAETA